jgi:hypothetical protein
MGCADWVRGLQSAKKHWATANRGNRIFKIAPVNGNNIRVRAILAVALRQEIKKSLGMDPPSPAIFYCAIICFD